MAVDNKMKDFGHGWSHTFSVDVIFIFFLSFTILNNWLIKTNKSTHADGSTGCTYNVVAGILGSGDCQHQNQRDNSGEPRQGGDLRNHLRTHTHGHTQTHTQCKENGHNNLWYADPFYFEMSPSYAGQPVSCDNTTRGKKEYVASPSGKTLSSQFPCFISTTEIDIKQLPPPH